jgi:hypothetical protein
LDLNVRKKLVECYTWKVNQKCLESFEMLCWRRMETISWTDHVRNEEVLHTAKEERNILQTIKRAKAKWIGHILHRNCLLKQATEGKLEGQIEWLEDEEEGASSYCMTSRKSEDTGN